MVALPGGVFAMGSARFYPEEAPVRPVRVAPFSIDRRPVTNAEFARFAAATGHVTTAEIAQATKLRSFNRATGPGCLGEFATLVVSARRQLTGSAGLPQWLFGTWVDAHLGDSRARTVSPPATTPLTFPADIERGNLSRDMLFILRNPTP